MATYNDVDNKQAQQAQVQLDPAMQKYIDAVQPSGALKNADAMAKMQQQMNMNAITQMRNPVQGQVLADNNRMAQIRDAQVANANAGRLNQQVGGQDMMVEQAAANQVAGDIMNNYPAGIPRPDNAAVTPSRSALAQYAAAQNGPYTYDERYGSVVDEPYYDDRDRGGY